jgi:hypothetical protein
VLEHKQLEDRERYEYPRHEGVWAPVHDETLEIDIFRYRGQLVASQNQLDEEGFPIDDLEIVEDCDADGDEYVLAESLRDEDEDIWLQVD